MIGSFIYEKYHYFYLKTQMQQGSIKDLQGYVGNPVQ